MVLIVSDNHNTGNSKVYIKKVFNEVRKYIITIYLIGFMAIVG